MVLFDENSRTRRSDIDLSCNGSTVRPCDWQIFFVSICHSVDALFHRDLNIYRECKECPSSKTSQDRQSAERLWKLSEEMTNLQDALKEIRNN